MSYYYYYPQHVGGGKCSHCGSEGTNKSTCPLNPKAVKPNPQKHPLAVGARAKLITPQTPVHSVPQKSLSINDKDLKILNDSALESQEFSVPSENTTTVKLETIIQTDPKLCAELTANMGELLNSGAYGNIIKYMENKVIKISNRSADIIEENEIECLNNEGCVNDILLEGLILYVLNKLKLEHFPRFYGLYRCTLGNIAPGYMIVMERLHNNMDYHNFIQNNALSNIDENLPIYLSILFQITYTLHVAYSKLHFVHGDLNSDNIQIIPVLNEVKEYTIHHDGKDHIITASNNGILVVLIDFGFSRIRYNDVNGKQIELFQKYYNQEWFATNDQLFDECADLCKIYGEGSPLYELPGYETTMINGLSLSAIVKKCNYQNWNYISVPPYPKLTSAEILLSALFMPIR